MASREYSEEARTKRRAASKAWHQRNRGKATELHRKWRERNPTWARDYHRRRTQLKPLTVMLSSAKGSAKSKGLDFDLKVTDFPVLPTHCPVLGLELTYGGGRKDSLATLDRVDNSQGYVPGNVIIICWRANFIKSNATTEELIRLGEFYGQLRNDAAVITLPKGCSDPFEGE